MAILMILVPAISILFFIAFEMPRAWRKQFVRLPVFLPTNIFAFFIGSFARGVFGPIAAFLGEIVLFAGLLGIRSITRFGERREQRKKKQT
ncbi:MAG: hypothetical protein WCX65_11210 [bacterium]